MESYCYKSYSRLACHSIDIYDPTIHEHNLQATLSPVSLVGSNSNADPIESIQNPINPRSTIHQSYIQGSYKNSFINVDLVKW